MFFKIMSNPSLTFKCQFAQTAIKVRNSFILKQQTNANAFAGKNVKMPTS